MIFRAGEEFDTGKSFGAGDTVGSGVAARYLLSLSPRCNTTDIAVPPHTTAWAGWLWNILRPWRRSNEILCLFHFEWRAHRYQQIMRDCLTLVRMLIACFKLFFSWGLGMCPKARSTRSLQCRPLYFPQSDWIPGRANCRATD